MNRLLILIFLLLAVALPTAAAEIRLSAAASLSEVVKELAASYQQRQADITLVTNFASSGSLAKQVLAGAPVDLYISANPKWMDYLQEQGLLAADGAKVLAHNSLVFVGWPATAAASLKDLPALQSIALGSPRSVPAGSYAEQALVSAGIYEQLQAGKKLVLAKDVRQALLYAERGEVDGAFVYRTDALLARQAKVLFSVPQELHSRVVYPAALTVTGRKNPAAEAFFNYLFSEEAGEILVDFGFALPLRAINQP